MSKEEPQPAHSCVHSDQCSAWKVPADSGSGAITLELPLIHGLKLTQGDATISITEAQLRVLVDKLYWLDEMHRADVQEAVNNFRCC
jgi:hypothetical protein